MRRRKADLLGRIAEKQQQAETALNLALGSDSLGVCFLRRCSKGDPSERSRSADYGFSRAGVCGRVDVSQRIEACRC